MGPCRRPLVLNTIRRVLAVTAASGAFSISKRTVGRVITAAGELFISVSLKDPCRQDKG
jgi:hypothetical protein